MLEGFGIRERPGNVSGVLMDVARDPAKRDLRTASRFKFAAVAIMLPRQIEQRGSVIHQFPVVVADPDLLRPGIPP